MCNIKSVKACSFVTVLMQAKQSEVLVVKCFSAGVNISVVERGVTRVVWCVDSAGMCFNRQGAVGGKSC
jgi:hypothetical protein